MKSIRENLKYYIILILNFYFLPSLIRDTGSGMFFLLMIMPTICFITSVAYGIKNGFHYWYALIVAVLFIPTIFVFFNISAWTYIIAYGVIALVGNVVALPLRKK